MGRRTRKERDREENWNVKYKIDGAVRNKEEK